MEYEQFDRRLARECAKAFSQSTSLGCTLSDKTGRAFDEYGYGCESCGMCAAAGASHDRCVQAHIYGMTEAERFGGKYIYFCPMGLTCFVSPILGEGGAECCFSKRMRKVFRKNEKSMLQKCNKKAKRKGRLQRVKKPM